ncbi:aminoacyl tRNA synthase complex-interacting multifunctional protein 1-like isoform X1 [Daktulosphaira vitifoliae]|uniref:aminoacyl tRNA synthase complex-interacting multifunctional protein 1-like isoform X1 n=2 Tax=Daktulosphaira vitifoliae TaxID=58002 RepID=UPI0021A9DB96|nr:aminoacyl tRNA synthase complex-interacting multifunctional protein 1-like isoform X1 [Daktulosphaira vitifoliae]
MDAVNKLKTVKTIHARLIETVKWHKKELANRYSVECERLKKEQESLKSQIQTELEKLKKIRSNNGVNYQIEENEKKSVSVNKDKITTDKCTADKKKSKDTVKKQKNNNTGGATNVQKNDSPVDIGRLDLRVGKIISASNHPNADSLYVEIVDLGEEKPRNVVSGLVKYVPLEKMSDRMAVLLCNLKPSKIRGVVSEAMVMCASTPDKVEILEPPAGAVPGDIISVEGYMRSPDKVLKVFDQVAEDLKTNDANQATYKGIPWTITNKGIVVAQSLKNVKIK